MSKRKGLFLNFGVYLIIIVLIIGLVFILTPNVKAEEIVYDGDGVSISYDNSYGTIVNVDSETYTLRHEVYTIIYNIEFNLKENYIWIQDEIDVVIYGYLDVENNYKFIREGNIWVAENPNAIVVDSAPVPSTGEDCNFEFPFADLVKEKSNTLTFNANGGNVSSNSIEVTNGEAIGTIPTPTREGYRFAGWYINETLIEENTVWSYTTDQTAIAKWVKQYSVNIQTDNSGYGTITNTIQGNYDEGSTITSIAISNDGYYFKNWQDEQGNIITTSNQLNVIVDNNINYTATFTDNLAQGVNVTATYGGKVSLVGDNFENLNDDDTIIFVATVAQQGYKFSHWENLSGNILGYTESIRLKKEDVYNNIITAVFVLVENNNVNEDINN